VRRLTVETESQMELVDITPEVRRLVRESGVTRGVCHLFVPHTTAAITLNESADPGTRKGLIKELLKSLPTREASGRDDGNAAAHVFTSLVGTSQTVFVEKGRLILGTWQTIYLCEFDGPRSRTILLRIQAK